MSKEIIDDQTLLQLGNSLVRNKLKLVCAESMTAGFLSSIFALQVCSGDYYLGSIVCYEEEMKKKLLQVSSKALSTYTAESQEVTIAMLQGLQVLVPKADVYVAITGLAFESPNPKQDRPVGRVYYAFEYKKNNYVVEKQFNGNAGQIIIATCNSLISDLYKWLELTIKNT